MYLESLLVPALGRSHIIWSTAEAFVQNLVAYCIRQPVRMPSSHASDAFREASVKTHWILVRVTI